MSAEDWLVAILIACALAGGCVVAVDTWRLARQADKEVEMAIEGKTGKRSYEDACADALQRATATGLVRYVYDKGDDHWSVTHINPFAARQVAILATMTGDTLPEKPR